MMNLTKALKGTKQYEEWLRKYREKRNSGVPQDSSKMTSEKVLEKHSQSYLLNNPPKFAKNKELWDKAVKKLTQNDKETSYASAVILYKKKVEKAELEKAYVSQQERAKLADKGKAMPDGSYPVRNKQDLKNAIKAIGRSKDPEATREFVIKRAKQLKCLELIPESWKEKN